jgi:hypothetical protein
MKRFLFILTLCGSALAQPPDFAREEHLAREIHLLDDRIREAFEQSTYYRRRALVCQVQNVENGYLEGAGEVIQDESKARVYWDLGNELMFAREQFKQELEKVRQ